MAAQVGHARDIVRKVLGRDLVLGTCDAVKTALDVVHESALLRSEANGPIEGASESAVKLNEPCTDEAARTANALAKIATRERGIVLTLW